MDKSSSERVHVEKHLYAEHHHYQLSVIDCNFGWYGYHPDILETVICWIGVVVDQRVKRLYAQDQHYQSGCNGWIVQGPVISRLSAAVSSGMGSQNC